MKNNISFEEFYKTVYYTEKTIVLPLINIRLDKVDFFEKGKLNFDKINSKIRSLYEEKLTN